MDMNRCAQSEKHLDKCRPLAGRALAAIKKTARPFRHLRWKLTLNYTVFTIAAILILQLAGFIAVRAFVPRVEWSDPQALARRLARIAPQFEPYLAGKSSGDLSGLLQAEFGVREQRQAHEGVYDTPPGAMYPVVFIVDRSGSVVAAYPALDVAERVRQSEEEAGLIEAALSGPSDIARALRLSDGSMAAAYPIENQDGTVLGALYFAMPKPAGLRGMLFDIFSWRNAVLVALIAGLVGAVFGALTARWLNRRLSTLAVATAAWGRGDFSVAVYDTGGDELSELAGRLNDMAGQLQSLLKARAQLAVVEERNRFARDLHDAVNQELYGVTLYAKAAAQKLERGEPVKAGEHLRELTTAAERALREMRLLIFELRPPALEKEGLAAALKTRLESVEERLGLETELKVDGGGDIPDRIERELYHVAQEALNNSLKHAHAGWIHVGLKISSGRAALDVEDDGIGFEPSAAGGNGGFGLKGMAERVAGIGGVLSVDSSTGGGARVSVEVSWNEAEQGGAR